MRYAEHASGRVSATKLGSIVAPLLPTNKVKRSRQRLQSSRTTAVPTPRLPNASGDFRYYVDTLGFQHFNFQQRIWRNPLVQMAVTPVMTTALETLALNLLTYITCESGNSIRVGRTSKRLVRLAKRFCAECLLTASPEGWVIPRSTIEEWLQSQNTLQVPVTNATRTRQRAQSVVARDRKLRTSYTNEGGSRRRTKTSARVTSERK
jgi:hypothetical protein